jgi:hypothetical protein
VRAVNKAGAGPWSAPASVNINPTNTAVIANACMMTSADFLAYKSCSTGYLGAGSRVNVQCRGTQSGVWFLYISSGPYAGWMIRSSDTQWGTVPSSFGNC